MEAVAAAIPASPQQRQIDSQPKVPTAKLHRKADNRIGLEIIAGRKHGTAIEGAKSVRQSVYLR